MGSENHATVQIVIKDTEEDSKKDEVKKEEVKKEEVKKVEEPVSSFIKAKEDPPKMAHPSTTAPPLQMTHS
jgi:hypothetical protein